MTDPVVISNFVAALKTLRPTTNEYVPLGEAAWYVLQRSDGQPEVALIRPNFTLPATVQPWTIRGDGLQLTLGNPLMRGEVGLEDTIPLEAWKAMYQVRPPLREEYPLLSPVLETAASVALTNWVVAVKGKDYRGAIESKRLNDAPSWESGADQPPLGARSAERLAREYVRTTFPDLEWRTEEIGLLPVKGNKWVYMVKLRDMQKRSGNSSPFPVCVYMDGTIAELKPIE